MRKLCTLLVVLCVFMALLVGCKSNNTVTMEKETLSEGEVAAIVFDNVTVFESADTQEFYNSITTVTANEDGFQSLEFSTLPANLKDIQKGEIIVVEPFVNNPNGYIGKFESFKTDDSKIILEFSTPTIDEVFKNLNIQIDQVLSSKNVLAFNPLPNDEFSNSPIGLKKTS